MFEPDPCTDAEDADLLQRMATGNREAFASLFRRYHGLVYRFSVQMTGSRDVAEDVTQEVFIALAKNHARYRPERGSLKAYLYGIARHLVVHREKRTWSRREVDIDALQGDDAHVVAHLVHVHRRTLTPPRRLSPCVAPSWGSFASLPEVIVLCELNSLS